MDTTQAVVDNTAAKRYELHLDGQTAFVAYRDVNGARVLSHTEVPDAFAGKGVGGRLVKGTLDLVKAEGRTIVPSCPFVRSYIERHLEYAPLVAGSGPRPEPGA
ncbi:MAG TPA: GNAT family N-acetyltransferase [Vicinamibacterales bacterium]|nr:GNAT family N-acetyltransferase [Vicinamibacterales bacterium]